MYTIIDSITEIDRLDSPVVVEPDPEFHGELVFQTVDPQFFYSEYRDWVSRHCVLSDLFNLDAFVGKLAEDGWDVVFSRSCTPILEAHRRWCQPLSVEGFKLTPYPFQAYGLNRALEAAQACFKGINLFFFGWCCGSGKSLAAAAGAQELFNRQEIDVVLAFTLQKLKKNFCKFFSDHTELNAAVVDGTPQRRQKMYADEKVQVYVLNYDKLWADIDSLKALVADKRVLLVADECHVLITDGRKNRCRKAYEEVLKECGGAVVWPMSATVVNHSPLRYRDVFNLSGSRKNPLGSKADFESRYAKRKYLAMYGMLYEWNLGKLQEVRHRVADRTQSIRKTDPALRDTFKGLQAIVVPVQMSREDRKLYDEIVEEARLAKWRDESLAPYYQMLRYVCNNPLALTRTEDPIGQALAKKFDCTDRYCSKLELFLDQVEALQDSDEQVVVFTQWTNLSLFFLRDGLAKRKIRHVSHYGVGQSAKESQAAQEAFKNDPSCTVFLSSDAGAYGLNFQNARYVINYEAPYSYDILHQRNSRIDRADSYLEGLTSYIYVTEDSVEERVWEINQSRKELASVTTGSKEVLGYGKEMSSSSLDFLIFGKGNQ